MEKDWPPLKGCPQYKYGMITHLLDKFPWEDKLGDSDEPVYYDSSDDEEEGGFIRLKYIPNLVKKFLQQARETRGYGVDVWAPRFVHSPFEPVELEKVRRCPAYQLILNNSIDVIIDHIKSKTKKVYDYVDTLRFVFSLNRILLLTFTAKEVAADAVEQTFYAAVFAAGHDKVNYELLECFLEPEGPAPTI